MKTRSALAWLLQRAVTLVFGLPSLLHGIETEELPSQAAHKVQTEFESLFARDLLLTQSSFSYGQKINRWDWTAAVAYNTIGLDYRPAPFDFLGQTTLVNRQRTSGQLGLRVRTIDSLTLQLGGGIYDGFTDYRSAWLSEYYRQQFSFLPEYQNPSPRGENLNLGARWEYLPGVGFLQADASYSHDEIAPGYEIDFLGLRRGRPNLYTSSYHIASENILGRRVRVLNEFRVIDTTLREQRYQYQGSINIALGDRWTARVMGGHTQEQPTFTAYHVGGSFEFEPKPGWLLSLTGRYYRDSGEIENSLFSSAAPGLESWQVGVGLRHTWGIHSFKIFAAPYFNRYEPYGIGTAFFQNLYRNRTWGIVQCAYAAEF